MDSEKLNLSTRMENILNWSNKMFGAMITSTDDETIKNLNEDSSNESVMSIANLSPIVKTGLFEELKPNETNEDFDKQLDLLKKSLNESLEDIKTINPKDYCPEEIDFNNLPEDRFLMNRVKADIVNKTAVTVTVDRHYGNLYAASDFHVFGVWDKSDNNNNATNIQQVNAIVDDINSKVKEDDTLIICGDLGYKLDDCLLPHTKYFLQSIRCKHIWLVVGNHDLLTNEQYKEFGCEIVCDRLEYNGWIFTHYPINTNKFNFHAHLHNETLINKTEVYKNMSFENKYNCFYYTKGITNINDVINRYLNNLSEASLKDSDVMFGNGEYTSMTDNRFTDFQTGNPFEQNEDIDPYTATFSPNNDKSVQDYMDASNNFETNEEVRVDMEIDPAILGPNTFASLSQSIYNSNFEI